MNFFSIFNIYKYINCECDFVVELGEGVGNNCICIRVV